MKNNLYFALVLLLFLCTAALATAKALNMEKTLGQTGLTPNPSGADPKKAEAEAKTAKQLAETTADKAETLVNKITANLKKLHQEIDAWGTLNISEPLVMKSIGSFSLDDSNDAWPSAFKYVSDAQTDVNGGVQQLAEKVLTASLIAKLAPALDSAKSNAANTTISDNATSTGNNSGFLSGDNKFLAAMGLMNGTESISLPKSSALKIGTSNKLLELALRKMSNPNARLIMNGSKLYVALVQISCNPGKRTTRHYIADISSTFEYAYRDGNGTVQALSCSDPKSQFQPMVFSVMPLLDAQTTDERNSQRDLLSLATTLAGTFPAEFLQGDAKIDLSYLKKTQRDTATKTARPVINSYTTGTGFGFRISPSFESISDPADPDSSGDNILLPTTFPAIVFLVMEPKEINTPFKSRHGTVTCPGWNRMVTHVVGHWYRHDDSWFFPRREESLYSNVERSVAIGQIQVDLEKLMDLYKPDSKDPWTQSIPSLRSEFVALAANASSLTCDRALPLELLNPELREITEVERPNGQPAFVTEIKPTLLDPKIGGSFAIYGEGLDHNCSLLVGGKAIPDSDIINRSATGLVFNITSNTASDLVKSGAALSEITVVLSDRAGPANGPELKLTLVQKEPGPSVESITPGTFDPKIGGTFRITGQNLAKTITDVMFADKAVQISKLSDHLIFLNVGAANATDGDYGKSLMISVESKAGLVEGSDKLVLKTEKNK